MKFLATINEPKKMTLRYTKRKAISKNDILFLQETILEVSLPSIWQDIKNTFDTIKNELLRGIIPVPAVA